MSTPRERFIAEMNGSGDGIVHSSIGIRYDVWKEHREQLDWLEGFSPHVSVNISREPGILAGTENTDIWGCRWHYPLEGLGGQVKGNPIADWSDPDEHTDWDEARSKVERAHAEGRVAGGNTDHGFVFLRLSYLRGFGNLMLDMADERPELRDLIAIVERYWLEVVKRWIALGVDLIAFGDDLGLQDRLPIGPEAWRKYLKPSFRRIFSYCRENGAYVHLHTDGYVVDIIPDLVECGVTTLNPQDLVNGIDTLERLAKGKVAINLDVDRQKITVFGTPDEVDAHIHRCVSTLGSPRGGLSFIWGVYSPTPLTNIEAGARAMDKYATYWVGRAEGQA